MSNRPADLKKIISVLDNIAPFALAEEWDNVGLMVGSHEQSVKGIMVGLDPTEGLLDEALSLGADLIVTHHPAIFKPLKSLRTDQPVGAFLAQAIRTKTAVISCHTNLDVIQAGVSAILAQKLGLTSLQPLSRPASQENPATGFGQFGVLQESMQTETFLQHLCQTLLVPTIQYAGTLPAKISKVALCGGSGSEFTERAHTLGADIYITGEVKHSTARWAEQSGFCIVDAGHFATENLVIESFAAHLSRELATQGINIPVHVTAKQENPFTFFHAQEEGETN